MAELLTRIEAWGGAALDAADDAIERAAADSADIARATVPVDTGDLQGTIASRRIEPFLSVVEAGGPAAPHVRPVEKRTGFFNRAVDQVEEDLRDRVAGAIQKVSA